MIVSRWGNSLAVRIPSDVARALNLKEGDVVDLCSLDKSTLAVLTERQRREAALDRLAQLAILFPDDYKFDREEANAR